MAAFEGADRQTNDQIGAQSGSGGNYTLGHCETYTMS